MKKFVELREQGRWLIGTILQEGRAASQRREVFAPGSVSWSSAGIALKDGHNGRNLATAYPQRKQDGSLEVKVPLTKPIIETLQNGREGLSVEFIALEERTTAGGIREITKAFVEAAAFVSNPEYTQGKTEIRKRKRLKWL